MQPDLLQKAAGLSTPSAFPFSTGEVIWVHCLVRMVPSISQTNNLICFDFFFSFSKEQFNSENSARRHRDYQVRRFQCGVWYVIRFTCGWRLPELLLVIGHTPVPIISVHTSKGVNNDMRKPHSKVRSKIAWIPLSNRPSSATRSLPSASEKGDLVTKRSNLGPLLGF